mmetsp:Transcript_935/g.2215  ORF Transcript_935/g.2215 Transcript_935/m.2215 type:complete len:358 (-) Transcript_935:135-1208(-)
MSIFCCSTSISVSRSCSTTVLSRCLVLCAAVACFSLYRLSTPVLDLASFSCSLSTAMVFFFSFMTSSCSSFSCWRTCRRFLTACVVSRSRWIVSFVSTSFCSSAVTMLTTHGTLRRFSSSERHLPRRTWSCARSEATLAMFSVTLGLSLRLRHSCCVLLLRRSATSTTSCWFCFSLDLFGMVRRTCCAVMSSSKRCSSSFCSPIMRVISSPTLCVSACAWTAGSTTMTLTSASLSSVYLMTVCACAASRIDSLFNDALGDWLGVSASASPSAEPGSAPCAPRPIPCVPGGSSVCIQAPNLPRPLLPADLCTALSQRFSPEQQPHSLTAPWWYFVSSHTSSQGTELVCVWLAHVHRVI